jgi:hypothetical protein
MVTAKPTAFDLSAESWRKKILFWTKLLPHTVMPMEDPDGEITLFQYRAPVRADTSSSATDSSNGSEREQ